MARPYDVQRKRARRGRRRKRRPEMRQMAAFNPRCRAEKWITRTAWSRKHPVRKKFSWGDVWKPRAPAKKLTGIKWWEEDSSDEQYD